MDQEELKQNLEMEDTIIDDEGSEQPEAPEVPAELEGLSPETIAETMAELEPKDESNAEDDGEGESAEPNSDNKSSIEPVLDRPKQKIPYERFKKEVDEKKNLRAELDSLRAEIAAMRAGVDKIEPPQSGQEPVSQQMFTGQQGQPEGMVFTPEVTNAIKEAIKEQAMQMSGLTQDDVENLDYMDDDDQRKQQWFYASRAAEAKVMNAIQQAQQERALRTQQFLEQHRRSVDGYNSFVEEQKSEPDFEAVKEYAGTVFLSSLPPDEQPVIREAYMRIDRNTASPADIALIKRFFQEAKTSYRSGAGQNRRSGAAVNKIKQASAHPRAESIEGSAAKTGRPSVATLERMLNEKNWDDIPKEYQDLLLGL